MEFDCLNVISSSWFFYISLLLSTVQTPNAAIQEKNSLSNAQHCKLFRERLSRTQNDLQPRRLKIWPDGRDCASSRSPKSSFVWKENNFYLALWQDKSYVARVDAIDADIVLLNFMSERDGLFSWPSTEDTSWEHASALQRPVELQLVASHSSQRKQYYKFVDYFPMTIWWSREQVIFPFFFNHVCGIFVNNDIIAKAWTSKLPFRILLQ